MSRGLRHDLIERLEESFEQRLCVMPESPSDAHRLRAAAHAGHVFSPFPQLYVLPNLWATLDRTEQEIRRIRTIAVLHPDWIFSDVSAATMHGLWVTHKLMDKVHIVTTPQAHSRSNKLVERHQITQCESQLVDGVRVTTLERTTFDCLRSYRFRMALPIADSALRKSGNDAEHFTRAFDAFPKSCPRHGRSVEVMGLANGLSDNGGESIARAVMIDQGYMVPDLQVEVGNRVDSKDVYRVDFRWKLDDGEVYGELDGRDKYVDPQMTGGRDVVDVLRDERRRESYISGNGAKILRFSYKEVMRTGRFRHLLNSFGIPSGLAVPYVASLDNPANRKR